MSLKEKLEILNESIGCLINIIQKMELDEELPALYMFLLGERSAFWKAIKELEGKED